MADLAITAANVAASGDAVIEHGIAGGTVTAGQVVYKDAVDGKFKLADNNATGTRAAYGIALHGSLNGQPLSVQRSGAITIGGTLTAGAPYYLSDTPGAIQGAADFTSGEQIVSLGFATSTTVLSLRPQDTGVVTP